MKFCVFVLVFVLIGAASAWKDKEKWKAKKSHHQSLMAKKHDRFEISDLELGKKTFEDETFDPVEFGEKTDKMKHYFGKKFHKKKGKYGGRRGWKKVHKAAAWLDMRSDEDCDSKCKEYELCISGPVINKPMCVHKKDLKKSMKLFHRYHKKEMKDWKKFQKKNYKKDWKLKKEKLRKMKEEKYGRRMKKYDLDTRKKDKREKLKKEVKLLKKDDYYVNPKYRKTVCGMSEMGQMKTRMMGWFHLLHGQDHEARKAHGGSIRHFYKHFSAKKEMREVEGEQCQCMKSAMWQFYQMDKDSDDHLTETEMSLLEANSLEPCMSPYLKTCDRNKDRILSSDEWCCCFANVLPPCFKMTNRIRRSGEPVKYMPRCDKEGYFMQEQCKGDSSDDSLTCWCVDYNGNEYKDTHKKGRAHCHKIEKYGIKQEMMPFV